MGEYYQGHKLGVMDDFRYVRRLELVTLDDQELQGYLDDPSTLYRFPWPDEDGELLLAIDKRDMFRTMWLDVKALGWETEHDPVCVPVNAGGAHTVHLWVPCPATIGADSEIKHSLINSQPIQIVGERYDEQGRPRTIFACGWCDKAFAVSADSAEQLRFQIREEAIARGRMNGESGPRQWYLTVAERIQARPA